MLAGVETRVEVTQPCLNEAFDEERELRPDVEINGGMGRLLVDVVVVNPVAPSNIARRSDASIAKSVEKDEKKLTAIEQAERTKRSKYVKLAETQCRIRAVRVRRVRWDRQERSLARQVARPRGDRGRPLRRPAGGT